VRLTGIAGAGGAEAETRCYDGQVGDRNGGMRGAKVETHSHQSGRFAPKNGPTWTLVVVVPRCLTGQRRPAVFQGSPATTIRPLSTPRNPWCASREMLRFMDKPIAGNSEGKLYLVMITCASYTRYCRPMHRKFIPASKDLLPHDCSAAPARQRPQQLDVCLQLLQEGRCEAPTRTVAAACNVSGPGCRSISYVHNLYIRRITFSTE